MAGAHKSICGSIPIVCLTGSMLEGMYWDWMVQVKILLIGKGMDVPSLLQDHFPKHTVLRTSVHCSGGW